MSKELPYFKFHSEQWLTGNITLESMEIQGVFINVCAMYWAKECRIEIAKLKQRYGEAINTLLKAGLIKEKDGHTEIAFLDEQYSELDSQHKINSRNGRKGAMKRWRGDSEAISHPIALRKDKIIEDNSIKDKEIEILHYPEIFNSIAEYFGFKESRYYNQHILINKFIFDLQSAAQIDEFKENFKYYKLFKEKSKQAKHSFYTFIAGAWSAENWKDKYKDITKGTEVSEFKISSDWGKNK